MEIIYKKRNMGKTHDLLELANNTEGHNLIVCHGRNAVDEVWALILKNEYNLPQPITFDDFINNRYHGMSFDNFFMDNVDLCLQSMSAVGIKAITLTEED